MIFNFNVVEHDPEKPWLIRSTRTGLSLEAASAEEFRELAAREWPPDRFDVDLAPGELVNYVRRHE